MNFKTTFILLILVLALAIGFFIANRGGSQVDRSAAPRGLLNVLPDSVDRVMITSGDGSKTTLERSPVQDIVPSQWQMTEPLVSRADSDRVAQLIEDILALKPRQQIPDHDIPHTGLDQPHFVIELVTHDQKKALLQIGNAQSVGGGMYVRVGGQKAVYVVSADLLTELNQPIDTLRDLQLAATPIAEIQTVTIHQKNSEVTLQRDRQNQWVITAPTTMPADQQQVKDLLAAIVGLRAVSFVNSATVDNRNMNPTFLTITLGTSPKSATASIGTLSQSITISFGDYDDILKKNVLVATSDSPGNARVLASARDNLMKSAIDLRDRTILVIDPWQVSKVRITIRPQAAASNPLAPTLLPANHDQKYELIPKVAVGDLPDTVAAPDFDRHSLRFSTTAPVDRALPGQSLSRFYWGRSRPPIVWEIAGTNLDVPNARMQTLFSRLRPLKAQKFLSDSSLLQSGHIESKYDLQLITDTRSYDFRFYDRGSDHAVIGQYDDLTFELPYTFLRPLLGDMTQLPQAEPEDRGSPEPQELLSPESRHPLDLRSR